MPCVELEEQLQSKCPRAVCAAGGEGVSSATLRDTPLAEELQRQASLIAGLKSRLKALTEPTVGSQPARGSTAGRRRPVCRFDRAPNRTDYRLCRCEGFEVDSPTRRVGVVDGLRYHSRSDRPDVLEVRAGRLDASSY